MRKYPVGYAGVGHETSGRDILAILGAVHVPELTFGPELATFLKTVQAEGWYPIERLLELLDVLDQKLGAFHLKQVGYNIVQRYLADQVKKHISNAHQLLHSFDSQYHLHNRGQNIGGWKVVSFTPGRAELEKTTPHHCLMEEGIFEEQLRIIGVSAKVSQPTCLRKGGPLCRFVVEARMVDERWGTPK